jgi:hypothetical protein
MGAEPKDVRLPVMATRSEAEAIDAWRFKNRVPTRAEAMRRLIRIGLEAADRREATDPE